ncbi:hypothetical protein CPB84DRAFT_1642454, partial [Gymnopilus junonius]
MVDDQLIESISDLMCGTYHVYTGKAVYQTAIMSWWPRASIWNGSGLNVNAWTEECEEWFIRHCNAILSGDAVPLNSHQWRN